MSTQPDPTPIRITDLPDQTVIQAIGAEQLLQLLRGGSATFEIEGGTNLVAVAEHDGHLEQLRKELESRVEFTDAVKALRKDLTRRQSLSAHVPQFESPSWFRSRNQEKHEASPIGRGLAKDKSKRRKASKAAKRARKRNR